MNTKHTPGPWHIGMKPGPMIYGSDSSQVADLRGDLLDRGEAQANAALIAAAPEMLTALCALLAAIDCGGHEEVVDASNPLCVKSARAAIAKATGVQS